MTQIYRVNGLKVALFHSKEKTKSLIPTYLPISPSPLVLTVTVIIVLMLKSVINSGCGNGRGNSRACACSFPYALPCSEPMRCGPDKHLVLNKSVLMVLLLSGLGVAVGGANSQACA